MLKLEAFSKVVLLRRRRWFKGALSRKLSEIQIVRIAANWVKNSNLQLKTTNEGVNSTADTKGGANWQTWRRLKRTEIVGFEKFILELLT